MIKNLKDVIRELLTGSDNVTHDLYNYLSIGMVLTFIGLSIYDVAVLGHTFNPQSFGIGAGGTLAGVGVALGLKPKTETVAVETKETP